MAQKIEIVKNENAFYFGREVTDLLCRGYSLQGDIKIFKTLEVKKKLFNIKKIETIHYIAILKKDLTEEEALEYDKQKCLKILSNNKLYESLLSEIIYISKYDKESRMRFIFNRNETIQTIFKETKINPQEIASILMQSYLITDDYGTKNKEYKLKSILK